MSHLLSAFFHDEAGAVTVDWVVLTAALVGLGLAVMTVIRTGATNLSTDAANLLCGIDITTNVGDVSAAAGSINSNGTCN
jgi:hypothetical protein